MNEDVIKEGLIKSASEICQLGIIDWNRTNGYWNNDASQAIQLVTNWLAKVEEA